MSESIPQNRAAWLPVIKGDFQVGPAPMPVARGKDVIIKVHAIAMNPCDPAIKNPGMLVKPDKYPFILGEDISGVVTAVGPNNTRFKPGDRVLAACNAVGMKDNKYGAFQEYAVGVEPFVAKIPDHVAFAQAAVLPLCMLTATYSLLMKHCLALDSPKAGAKPNGKLLLVWGGASSVGACGIQTARCAGYTIAATSRERNFGLLKDMGVDYVFDYKKENIFDEIVSTLKATGLPSVGVFSAIIDNETVKMCAEVVKQLGGQQHVGTVPKSSQNCT